MPNMVNQLAYDVLIRAKKQNEESIKRLQSAIAIAEERVGFFNNKASTKADEKEFASVTNQRTGHVSHWQTILDTDKPALVHAKAVVKDINEHLKTFKDAV